MSNGVKTRESYELRLALLALTCAAALPVRAHADLSFTCGTIVHLLPALVLLFVPWHRWRVRVICAATLVLGVVILWQVAIPRLGHRDTSAPVEWLVILSPTLLAYALAAALRILSPPRAEG